MEMLTSAGSAKRQESLFAAMIVQQLFILSA
jgi:hypothetical protein